jgi:hypothetical protein
MKIIKDFLPEEEFKIIEEQIFNEDFPWFFNDGIVDKGDGNFQLTHLLYHKKAYTGMKNSVFFDTFYPVFDKLNIFSLLKAKLNCIFKTHEIKEHKMHQDITTKHEYKTAILYLNTNNGYTKFSTGEKVMSERNKLISFDGHLEHTGTTNSCDELRRVCLNINYLEAK